MIVFFAFHPAPYRDPVIEAFQRLIGGRLHIYFLHSIDNGHQEWKHSSPVSVSAEYADKNALNRYARIMKLIFKSKIVFIPCYHLPVAWWMIFLSLLLQKKYILSFDTCKRQRNKWSHTLNKFVIFRHASYFFVPGNATRTYLISTFKICDSRIITGFYLMNPSLPVNSSSIEDQGVIDSLREIHNAHDKKIILFVGKLIRTRRALLLLQVFESLRAKDVMLIIVGSGPEFESVKSAANRINSVNCNQILLIPSVPLDQLDSLFRIASCYIHPGKEPFSTAVQLAYFYRVPIVASLEVGVVHDLLLTENPPCIYDYYSVDSLKQKLEYTIATLESSYKKERGGNLLNIYMHPDDVAKQLFCAATKLGIN